MKKSELQEYIKEMIVSELTEVDLDDKSGAVIMKKNTNPVDIKNLTSKGVDVQLVGEDMEDREPTKAELEKEKIKGAPSKFKISQEQYEKLKKTLKTVVDKVKELDKKIKDPNTKQDELKDLKDQKTRKMESLKQFIKNPELVKAFKERDVQIDTDDLIG
jgi:uncharacterized protein (DUF3084 family)